jgi:Fuc2NAc and GlcNAc transferase
MIVAPTDALHQLLPWVSQHRVALLFAACAGLGALGAWLVAGIPFREHLLDAPSERGSHAVPTPRGGGAGILAAFILAGLTLRIPTTFLFAAILLSAVSFYGDYFRISVKFRFLVQFLTALMLIFPLLPRLSSAFSLSASGNSPFLFFLILPLAVLFLVGTANLYNFMDGINGMAGLSGAIAFGLLGACALHHPAPDPLQKGLSLLAICISLACLGYLPFNMPRARVFMGDVGSILLGFVFAALVVILARNCLEMVCFAALLFPFYADGLTTMAVRLHDHENLTVPHRRHLYQLLVNELGIAHARVTLLYGVFQLTVGVAALAICGRGVWPVLFFLTCCVTGFTLVSARVRKRTRNI